MDKKIFFILTFFCSIVFARNGSVSGFVHDAANGEAIIGANVYIKDLNIGSSTNHSGYYVIPEVPPGEHILITEYLGYKTDRRTVRLHENEELKQIILLNEEILQAETIVVTADSLPTIEKLYRKPISEISLNSKQIKRIPQVAEADLLRSLQTLPGVLPVSDFSSALYIRGGTSDQNLYLLDGTDVYNPEHAFGLFSTFNTDAIKQVNLSKGGFGAEYGGRLSSILDITNLDGNREEFEGTASISLLSAKTTLQMPIGTIGSVSGSIRRTYFDVTIAEYIDDIPDYYFWDGNLKAFLDLDANNKLTISGYGGRDVLDVIFNNDATEQLGFTYDWGNSTGSIRWTHIFSPQLFSNFWFTASRFSSVFNLDEFDVHEENDVTDLTFKGDLEYHITNELSSRFGFELKSLQVDFKQRFPNGNVNVENNPEHYVGYLQGIWQPNSRWEVNAGVRFNYFNSDKDFQNLAPRFAAKYRLTEKINLKFAAGRYYQFLHRIPRFIAADIWTVSNRFQRSSASNHIIFGFQQELLEDLEFEVETYYKDYSNIFAFNQNFITEIYPEYYVGDKPVYTSTDGLFNRGNGESWGVEFLLRKDLGRLTGWVGYSFSNTRFAFDTINNNERFAPRHDRAHAFNLVASYDLSGRQEDPYHGTWHVGANFVYTSGQPYTEPGSAYLSSVAPGDPLREEYYAPTVINNIRFPAYARLDVSITYKKRFRHLSLEPYLQIFNIGNRKNIWFLNYDFENGIPKIDEQYMLPILPTLGITVRF